MPMALREAEAPVCEHPIPIGGHRSQPVFRGFREAGRPGHPPGASAKRAPRPSAVQSRLLSCAAPLGRDLGQEAGRDTGLGTDCISSDVK